MREIKILIGDTIDVAYDRLKKAEKEFSEECFCKFNGKEFRSSESIDDAYMKVIGKTKTEFDREIEEERQQYIREKEEHEKKIPELSEKYREAARGIILEDKYEYWDKVVPIRLGDLYRGMELDCTLDLCKAMRDDTLPYDERLRKAYDIFMNQGHSGMSAGLVASMLREFCPDGEDLADAVMNFRFEEKQK